MLLNSVSSNPIQDPSWCNGIQSQSTRHMFIRDPNHAEGTTSVSHTCLCVVIWRHEAWSAENVTVCINLETFRLHPLMLDGGSGQMGRLLIDRQLSPIFEIISSLCSFNTSSRLSILIYRCTSERSFSAEFNCSRLFHIKSVYLILSIWKTILKCFSMSTI